METIQEQIPNCVITRTFPIQYDIYLKFHTIKFRVRCPHCARICKHAKYSQDGFHINPVFIKGIKPCIYCNRLYQIILIYDMNQ